jgi:MFS family permease
VFRWVSRSWSAAIGRHRVILLGLIGHTAGFLLLIPVASDWGFILPSLCNGFGHALLFPCVISLGAGAFPPEYRGTGTTVILAFVDLGTMLSAPLLGRIIESGDDGFTRMYLATAAFTSTICVIYGLLTFRVRDVDGLPHPDEVGDGESELDDEDAVVPIGAGAAARTAEPVTCRRA